MDPQQPASFEVRLRHPPGPRQILEQAVFEQIDHGPHRLLMPGSARHGFFHEIFRRRVERAEHRLPNAVMREFRHLVERPQQERRAPRRPA
jgi:hypothetical protein